MLAEQLQHRRRPFLLVADIGNATALKLVLQRTALLDATAELFVGHQLVINLLPRRTEPLVKLTGYHHFTQLMRNTAAVVLCTPHVVVVLQRRQVVPLEVIFAGSNGIALDAQSTTRQFLLQSADARLLNIEEKPLGNHQIIFRIGNGNVRLGIPVAQIEVVVTLYLVFIFYHRAYLDLRNAELHELPVLVDALLVDHRLLHLRLHRLSVFQIIGNGLRT